MHIDTPCIGICSSVYGDPICRGCKRTAKEVIDWNRYNTAEKSLIYQRLQAQMAIVLVQYIEIFNPQLLQEKIIKLNIRLHPQASDTERAFHILRLGANKINHLSHFGLRIKPKFADLSLTVLFNEMDEKIYALASTT
jgi:predicted Fe-S protein YdhL (DUF1289 family)